MYRIKNTADDRTKTLLHRTASQFQLEPVLGSRRIRLGESVDITDEHYERVKGMIDAWVSKGMVSVTKLGAEKKKTEPKVDSSIGVGFGNTEAVDKLEMVDPITVADEVKVEEKAPEPEKVEIKEEPKKSGRPKKF